LFAKNLNTFFGVDQNTQISSYVENIFTETSNFWFGVSVNIFSTYEEMEPIRFGSKIERLVLLEHVIKFFQNQLNLEISRKFFREFS